MNPPGKKTANRRRTSPNWTISARGRAIAELLAEAFGCSAAQAVDQLLTSELVRGIYVTEEKVIALLTQHRQRPTDPDPLA